MRFNNTQWGLLYGVVYKLDGLGKKSSRGAILRSTGCFYRRHAKHKGDRAAFSDSLFKGATIITHKESPRGNPCLRELPLKKVTGGGSLYEQ